MKFFVKFNQSKPITVNVFHGLGLLVFIMKSAKPVHESNKRATYFIFIFFPEKFNFSDIKAAAAKDLFDKGRNKRAYIAALRQAKF